MDKEELKKVKNSIKPNIIADKLKAIEEVDESKINESSIDQDVLYNITKLSAYNMLKEDFRKSIDEFTHVVNSSDSGYDEGDTDHNLAFNAAIQEAIDELIGW